MGSVVERTAAAAALLRPGVVATSLPPLAVRDIDRRELQYVSTVNGFLTDSPVLCSLLDRQSNHNRGTKDRMGGGEGAPGGSALEKRLKSNLLTEGEDEEEGKLENEDLAYDMMMGNYNRVALFVNDVEKRDAADVLNRTAWQQHEITSNGSEKVDASATAETLMGLLNQRMRELEAETCRRLIRWEDEKYSSAMGIMNKKRMKHYFASLPARTSTKIAHDVNFDLPGRTSASVTHDLGEYAPVSLKRASVVSDGKAAETSGMMKPVNVEDIEAALSEMLPLIAREAYFTAALFGLSSRHLDGRQKKRNFEAAKKSVDNSSQYFRYYMNRICGIASKEDAEGKKVKGDAMLSLVASIHLNEAMDGYIDRNKKGGDHSLSLAYVRATILDLRKKVDKQWVIWVEDQIKWIRTNPGVPPNGKRAGIFASISRLPSYLDHVLICCKAGRPKDYTPNLAKIKVVSYYLQKMASALFASLNECAERETTDQQYAANVMRMENSYFFTQGIKQRGIEPTTLFQKQITGASVICKQSTDAYLGWMIKREFKAMHSLFSNISRVRKDVGDADVPIHVPRAQFVRTLQKESSKEIMKEKIGVVYARMEKHLSESGGLLPVAWKALVKVLYEWFGRWEKLSTSCYKFILEPSAIDVVRIAKSASGVSASSSGKRTIEHKYVSI